MDTPQITGPRSSIRTTGALTRVPAPARQAVLAPEEHLAAARRFTYQLPLGSAPAPLAGRERLSFGAAALQLERALWAAAVRHGLVVAVDEPPAVLAGRLVRARAIAPAAGEALAVLMPVLVAGATTGSVDAAMEPTAAKLAERLTGYLRSRFGPSGHGRLLHDQ